MVAFVDAIGDIPNNQKIETKLTEVFMRGRKLDIFFIQNRCFFHTVMLCY